MARTKEQILTEIETFKEQRRTLEGAIRTLEQELIELAGFKVGDKVYYTKRASSDIRTPHDQYLADKANGEYYIYEVMSCGAGEYRYDLTTPKKDGTCPKRPINPQYYVSADKLTRID